MALGLASDDVGDNPQFLPQMFPCPPNQGNPKQPIHIMPSFLQCPCTNPSQMLRFPAAPVAAPWHDLSHQKPNPNLLTFKHSASHSLTFATSANESLSPVALDDNQDENQSKGRHASIKGNPAEQWSRDSDAEMLALMEDFKDSYPIIRTYRNDLCNFEICGTANRSSVLTAMASDRSFTAASNMKKNRPLTVLQTVLPGSSGDHSTISTKLFAPSSQVAERANKLSFPKGLSSTDFVHKFFQSVEMLELSKFYIDLHIPGTRRDLSALDRDEILQKMFSFEASHKSDLDQFGRAISAYAISNIKHDATEKGFFRKRWKRSQWIPSQQSPIRFCILSKEEIESQAEQLKTASTLPEDPPDANRLERSWWPAPISVMDSARKYLDKATDNWIYEYLPMHKLHINLVDINAVVTGGSSATKESRECFLTHAQVVDLANAFDLYYEDRFTLSDKSLDSGASIDFQYHSSSKVTSFIEATAIGSLMLGIGVFAWLVAARMSKPSVSLNRSPTLNTVAVVESIQTCCKEPDSPIIDQMSGEELESLCKLVVTKMLAAFSWDLGIQSCIGKGAWTHNDLSNSLEASNELMCRNATYTNENPDDGSEYESEKFQNSGIQGVAQEQLHYQVLLSRDGTVLGFQPRNQAAVSYWAAMPFAKTLHGRKKLVPGFWEWPLKYRKLPTNVAILNLHVSMNKDSPYVSAMPVPL